MDVALSQFIKLMAFSTGRRMFALRQVHSRAVVMGATAIAARAALAIEHDRKTRRLDTLWVMHKAQPRGTSTIAELDGLADNLLSGLRDAAVALTRGARSGDPLIAKVEELVGRIFPAGVVAVTSRPYVEQLAAMEEILDLLRGELAPLVVELGLGVLTGRLAMLIDQYREALEARPVTLSFDEVRKSRAIGQRYLIEVVALILGTYCYHENPANETARRMLLEPVIAQNEAIRNYLRARRSVEDVDPETGEPDGSVEDSSDDGNVSADSNTPDSEPIAAAGLAAPPASSAS